MLIPFMVILSAFGLGLLSRHLLGGLARRSYVWSLVHYYFTYKFLIIGWGLMCVPIFVNIVNILEGETQFITISKVFTSLYVYFGVATIAYYSYMSFLTVNPQVGESFEQWAAYTETPEFQKFEAFHLMIADKDWKKRNFNFILSILRIITFVVISARIIDVPNLIIQITYLIYLFTLRPFKYEFFNYCTMGIQIAVILFYLYRYIVVLYMSISD